MDVEIIKPTTAKENSLIYLGIKIFRTRKISTFLNDIQSCLDLIRLLFQSLDDQSKEDSTIFPSEFSISFSDHQ